MENKGKVIREIKQDSDQRLYDTSEEKYVLLDELLERIKSGEEVRIKNNETGEDITASVIARLLAGEKKEDKDDAASGLLIQLLRKGSSTMIGYARKYTELWQDGLTMAEDEIDKLIRLMIKSKEISESEGNRLKKELLTYHENFKTWISHKIDQRVTEMLNMMNLATKEQMLELTTKIDSLTEAVEKLEKLCEKNLPAESTKVQDKD